MEPKITCPTCMVTMRLIKSEDLNHHGTLFAGRTAEWFGDESTRPSPRFLEINPVTDEDRILFEKAKNLRTK